MNWHIEVCRDMGALRKNEIEVSVVNDQNVWLSKGVDFRLKVHDDDQRI